MRKLWLLLLLPLQLFAQPSKEEINRWQMQASSITIIRDNFGIPHIYGKTDADAVFGSLYAQCEDDFNRVEMNYIEKLGRMAEIMGESELYEDLLIRLVIDSTDAINDFNKAPVWLQKLCTAYADGINYYLYKHPNKKPALLNRFQPWYPLLWTDGSIGAINTDDITADDLKALYGGNEMALSNKTKEQVNREEEKPTGSNGFAFSPKITASGNAILYINPHVTFYFRPEMQMVSDEGLDAYGAVTWGQFFIYQGFNTHCGWMHTSSYTDAADEYIEKLQQQNGKWFYEYEHAQKPVIEKTIVLKYKKEDGLASKTITALYTGHGPIMAKRNGQYLSVKADNRLMNGLIQCWQRTKTKSFADYKKTMALLGNISNNTVYADAEGNIAYWHGNRIPIRDTTYDWSKPVDGTIAATEWKGYYKPDETVHVYNPPNGWLQNCNSTPFTVAGANSPQKKDYPPYMAPDPQNFRGVNAVRVLSEESHYTIDKVIKAGYDKRLAAFEVLVPALVQSYEKNRNEYASYTALDSAINILKNWDYRCGENSIATMLAITWGEKILPAIVHTELDAEDAGFVEKATQFTATASAEALLQPMLAAITDLQNKFGNWQISWGDINRFQRISADIDNKFDDSKPSIPVGFASSTWGMLPSFASRSFPGTEKRYGAYGNSFICVVEFGKHIQAKSLLAGGESGDPSSPHFFDQANMYSKGQFKDVLFYKEDVLKHAEKTYHPGE